VSYNIQDKGLTLIEIIVVIIILGILAALTFPRFTKTKESSLDMESKANLRLIQAAEKIYRMENDFYYPYANTSDTSGINEYLKLSLPTDAKSSWNYTTSTNGTTSAIRNTAAGRTWNLLINQTEPVCSGADCP